MGRPRIEPEPPANPVEADVKVPADQDLSGFLIRENAFGPGTHSVKFQDGTPVGVWLADKHPRLDATGVLSLLLKLGLQEPHASDFARRRAQRDSDTRSLAAVLGPDWAWEQFVRLEEERGEKLEPLRKAFIEAKTKGEKK